MGRCISIIQIARLCRKRHSHSYREICIETRLLFYQNDISITIITTAFWVKNKHWLKTFSLYIFHFSKLVIPIYFLFKSNVLLGIYFCNFFDRKPAALPSPTVSSEDVLQEHLNIQQRQQELLLQLQQKQALLDRVTYGRETPSKLFGEIGLQNIIIF